MLPGVLVFCFGAGLAAVAASDVTGVVRDETTGEPISGALVTLQASGIRSMTGADGTFSLSTGIGVDLVVVAAHKGYYNEPATVDAPGSGVEILLEAVPRENNVGYVLQSPEGCGSCHPDQLEQWRTAPMARAGTNTWVHDIYSGKATPGGMGGFVYLRDSIFAESNAASECASCHQPESWIQNPFSALRDPEQPPPPEVMHGISCEVCHKIADVDVTKINYPGIFPGAVDFTRPNDPRSHQVEYGVLGDVDFEKDNKMRASYQPQLVAEACASCHQDANDPEEDHSFSGVISEPTYLEWLASPYGDPDSASYKSCVDCHMPSSGAEKVCNILSPALLRDPSTIRSHAIEGTTPRFLENAAELSIGTGIEGGRLIVDVDVSNSLTGHHVPTGVTVRNMILLVEAWRAEDGVPLVDTGGQTIHDLGGVGDPARGYYAGLPGKFYAKVNHDARGNGPTFFTDATGIQFDNRISALATDSTRYAFTLPADAGTLQVRARLIYRRAFRFLVDAKQWTENGHGEPLEDLAPPHFGHLMEQAESTRVYSTLKLEETGSPNEFMLSWPASPILRVESAPTLPGSWTLLDGSVSETDGTMRMTVSPLADNQFFRLSAYLPLSISKQPQSRSADPGANVTFSVVGTGAGPLGYQWRFNGTDIADATDSNLTLINVQATESGPYSVVVTDDFNSITSDNAILTISPSP